jgi:Na+/H+ antiporter NhaD/arsenite permease-like protein
MEDLAGLIVSLSGDRPFTVYVLVVWFSMLLSAFIDNVPFLLAMLPVSRLVAGEVGMNPHLLYLGLLLGASLGGNVTPIGASANIVAMGILRKQGYTVRFGEFVRIGLPFTLAAVAAGTLFGWLVFSGSGR